MIGWCLTEQPQSCKWSGQLQCSAPGSVSHPLTAVLPACLPACPPAAPRAARADPAFAVNPSQNRFPPPSLLLLLLASRRPWWWQPRWARWATSIRDSLQRRTRRWMRWWTRPSSMIIVPATVGHTCGQFRSIVILLRCCRETVRYYFTDSVHEGWGVHPKSAAMPSYKIYKTLLPLLVQQSLCLKHQLLSRCNGGT